MPVRQRSRLFLGGLLSAALGAYLASGALAPIDAGRNAPRVGVLPAAWILLAAAAAASACWVLTVAPGRRALPLFSAWLFVLPWIPGAPALQIWTGPIAAWVAVAIVLGLVLDGESVPDRLTSALIRLARPSWVPWVLAIGLYLIGAIRISPLLPAGDEPHYLIIAQSLIRDADLQVENNYRRGDYHAYFDGSLAPDYLRRGVNGQIYSIHAPGLPAVVAPAFALFGHWGVMVLLAGLSAAGTLLVWTTVRDLTGSLAAAWFGWATVALSVPFFFHAFTVYPDGLGAVLVMVAVSQIVKLATASDRGADAPAGRAQILRWLFVGGALALLPWFHTRFVVAACLLGVILGSAIIRRAGRGPALVAFAIAPAVSAVLWFGFFYTIYGTLSPTAPYGDYTQSALANVGHGLMGLLFDQQFGLLPNAPAYGFAFAGLPILFRRQRLVAIALLATSVPYALVVAAYYMWWGGWSAPARFIVPVLLPFGIPAGTLFAWARRDATRAVGLAALTLSLAVTASLVMVDHGALVYNDRDVVGRWLEWIAPAVELSKGLPSVFRTDVSTALTEALIWLGAVGAGILALRMGERSRTSLTLQTPLAGAAVVMLATTAVWAVEGTSGRAVGKAQTYLLRKAGTSGASIGVRYEPPGMTSVRAVTEFLHLGPPPRQLPAGDAPWLDLPHLPAGRYRLAVGTHKSGGGRLAASVGRSSAPLAAWSIPSDRPAETFFDLFLPVGVPSLRVTADSAAKETVDRISLEPVDVAGLESPWAGREAKDAVRYGSVVAYWLDGIAYLEPGGIWIGGGHRATLVIAPDAGRADRTLFVRNAPVDNRLALQGPGLPPSLRLRSREETTLAWRADSPTAVEILPERGFRPFELDTQSGDGRLLGCWIRFQ